MPETKTKMHTPACPMCGSNTRLEKRHANHRIEGETCVFKCVACGVVYPVIVTRLGSGDDATRRPDSIRK